MRRQDLRGKTPEYLYKSCRLCAHHFEESQFYCSNTKDRLLPYAVSTLFSVPNPPAALHSGSVVLKRHAEVSGKMRGKHARAIGNLFVSFICLSNYMFTFFFFWLSAESRSLTTISTVLFSTLICPQPSSSEKHSPSHSPNRRATVFFSFLLLVFPSFFLQKFLAEIRLV